MQERYLRAVLREIDAPWAWAEDVRRADSLYIGGGRRRPCRPGTSALST